MNLSILGSYGEHNLGDEAILEGFLSFVCSEAKQNKVAVFSHSPTKSPKIHRFPHVTFRPMIATGLRSFVKQMLDGSFLKSFRLLRESDVIIIGGGGLFHEKEVGQKGFSPVFVWFLRMLLFRFVVRRPVYLLGIGISKLESRRSQWYMNKILQWSSKVMVRDIVSLTSTNPQTTDHRLQTSGDLAWLSSTNPPQRTFHHSKPLQVVLQLREVLGLKKDQLLEQLSIFLELLVESFDAHVVFLPLSFEGPDDRVIQKELISLSNHQKNFELLECSSPQRVRDELQKVDIVITTRFHGFILALQTGAIPIVLSYASKTDSLVKEFQNFSDENGFPVVPSFSVFQVQAGELLNTVKFIHENAKQLQEAIRAFTHKKNQEVTKCIKELFPDN